MKKVLSVLSIFIIFNCFAQESAIENLTLEFKAITDDTLVAGGGTYDILQHRYNSNILSAHQGMKMIRLRILFKNEGAKNCRFDLSNTYLSTEKDSLYPFTSQEGIRDNEIKIKPQKSIQRVLIFEFPKNANPKELFIEDKRYKVLAKNK